MLVIFSYSLDGCSFLLWLKQKVIPKRRLGTYLQTFSVMNLKNLKSEEFDPAHILPSGSWLKPKKLTWLLLSLLFILLWKWKYFLTCRYPCIWSDFKIQFTNIYAGQKQNKVSWIMPMTWDFVQVLFQVLFQY